jgi:hypothetical protein
MIGGHHNVEAIQNAAENWIAELLLLAMTVPCR